MLSEFRRLFLPSPLPPLLAHAQDLISHLINTDEEDRYSAKEAMESPWIKNRGNKNSVHSSFQQGLSKISAESKARLATSKV